VTQKMCYCGPMTLTELEARDLIAVTAIRDRFARLDPDRADRLGRQIIAMLDAEAAYETERQEIIRSALDCFGPAIDVVAK
jgi:hypothetical protein